MLAAGHGTRLRPITDHIPKCLVPIGGVPLLAIWFDLFQRYGINEVLLNLHAHSQAVRDFLAKNSDAIRVRLFEEPVLLGSAGTVRANRAWVESEPSFWVIYADVLTRANLARMAEFHQQHNGIATLGVCPVPDPQRSGIVNLAEGGIIRQFVEKPQNPMGNLAFGGIMLARPGLFENIPDKTPADLGHDVLPLISNQMYAHLITEYHRDIGTMESYETAQTDWPGLLAANGAKP